MSKAPAGDPGSHTIPHDLDQELQQVLSGADILFSAAEIDRAYQQIAVQIDRQLDGQHPVMMPILMGGLIPAANITRHMRIPHTMDYCQASRYGHSLSGNEIRWLARPHTSLENRVIVLIDDILDEGITLKIVKQELQALNPLRIYTAVLARKLHDRGDPDVTADFTGIEVSDRFVFGCGLDYKGYFRNLPDLHAMPEEG